MAHTNSEKLCLNWNDFSKNVTTFFKELRGDQELSDVTLVSSDGEEIEAHKVILASGSGFFQNLFLQSVKRTTHPLLYMRGLKTTELNLIVDFLYQGEVSVPQDQLEDFLALATELQLKGLSSGGREPEIAHKVISKTMTRVCRREKSGLLKVKSWMALTLLLKVVQPKYHMKEH